MAVVARIWYGDEKVTEFIDDERPTVLALTYNGEVTDYLQLLPVTDMPSLEADEDAILAWNEAGELFYDRSAETRERLIELATNRGDLVALATLGVGGRRHYDPEADDAPLALA